MEILIADDDAVTRRTLEKLLSEWGHSVECVDNGASAWDRLSRGDGPPIAILDWMMPKLNGVELCHRIRKRGEEPPSCPEVQRFSLISMTPAKRKYKYVMLLTSRESSHDMVSGLEAGADDYLIKPIRPAELKARLQTGIRVLELEQRLLTTQAALQERATKDPLTGLWNRGAILEILEQEVARLHRDENTLTVQIIDLDHFKRINDTHGHLTGDAVLQQTAERMQATLRKSDWLGRYGGEEFLVVHPNCDLAQGIAVGERIRQEISNNPVVMGDAKIPLTLSVGSVSVERPSPGLSSWNLLREADNALYSAKEQGRNRVVAVLDSSARFTAEIPVS